MPPFEMQLTDVFLFRDGRTVFTGLVESGPDPIPACRCRLVAGDVLIAEIKLEGEMLPERRVPGTGDRGVSTFDVVDIDPALIRSKSVRLVCTAE